MKKQTTTLLAALALASTSFAGTAVVSAKESKEVVTPSSCFRDQELQIDLSYSYNNAIDNGSGYFSDHSGGGVGVSFFFARYFGIGVEGNWFAGGPDDAVLHQVTGNLILRYPLEMRGFCVAPYVFVGGGEVFDGHSTSQFDTGVGAELRLTPHIGVFTDWRFNFMNNDRGDLGTSRAGVRFSF